MGYVNPWAMVKVRLGCASKHGAHIGLEMAMEIEATYDDVVVTMEGGKVNIFAMKVILCTNAYTNMFLLRKELSLQTYIFSNVLEDWRERSGVLDMDAIHHLGA